MLAVVIGCAIIVPRIVSCPHPPVSSYTATCAAIRDSDFRRDIAQIRVETVVIAGTQDKVTPPEEGHYLAERIPGSKYVELDAAHLSNVEMAPRFSEEVLEFLAH